MIKIVRSISEMKKIRSSLQGSVGFIPTMGALHEGHLSLVQNAQNNDTVIVSIYVNPSQFGENEDLDSYPRNLQKDVDKLSKFKVDYVFCPTSVEMYPNGYKTWISVDEITQILCGASRPTHFKGVTTIVSKLINIVKPDFMYMGLKDFQQIVVLETMINDLNFDTKIVRCPIIREDDGLAKSSRNEYLDQSERKNAVCLSQSLLSAKQSANIGDDAQILITLIGEKIRKNNGKIDYIKIVNTNTLENSAILDENSHIILAVFMGKTRLIDNMKLF